MGETERAAVSGGDGTARKGDWVEVHSILLSPEERSPKVPDDTKRVPLEMWARGFLLDEEAGPGDEVEIETAIGRRLRGRLSNARPGYSHSFGESIPELLRIGKQLRELARDGSFAGEAGHE